MDKKFPTLLEQISNISDTGKDILLNFLSSGKIKADSSMQKDRIEICLNCEFLADNFRCLKCGCFIKVKSKLLFANCPLRKWPQKEYK